MPSFPDFPVVRIVPAPMNNQEGTVSIGDRTLFVRQTAFDPISGLIQGGDVMVRKTIQRGLLFAVILAAALTGAGQRAHAAGIGQPYDWGRFYYYPYVYY